MPMIDPRRLRELRGGMSRRKLAERARISERQLQRLESDPGQNRPVREHTLTQLAKALGVDIGVLTGKLSLPESDVVSIAIPIDGQVGARVSRKVQLAYDLIKRRYDVSTTEIIAAAPLFFVLLAESSLARRRKNLEKTRPAIEKLRKMWEEIGNPRVAAHLGNATMMAQDTHDSEKKLIDKPDIFQVPVSDHRYFDPLDYNPFATYLRDLSEDLDRLSIVKISQTPIERFPDYDLCSDEIERIANGSKEARFALEHGEVRLSDIPEDLKSENARAKRAEWLEEKLPEAWKRFLRQIESNKTADMLLEEEHREEVSKSEVETE